MKPDTPPNLFTDKRPPRPPAVNQNINQNTPTPATTSVATKAETGQDQRGNSRKRGRDR